MKKVLNTVCSSYCATQDTCNCRPMARAAPAKAATTSSSDAADDVDFESLCKNAARRGSLSRAVRAEDKGQDG
jgi:hypothetical protein